MEIASASPVLTGTADDLVRRRGNRLAQRKRVKTKTAKRINRCRALVYAPGAFSNGKSSRVVSGTCDRHRPDRRQRPALDVGTCDRFVSPCAACGAGREGRKRIASRAGAGVRSRQIPLHGTNRHHADRRAVGRLFRRDARPAPVAMAAGTRCATELCRCHRRRRRRHRHHLCVADRRRTGAEADRAARSRSDRREGCTRDESGWQRSRCRWCGCSIVPARCCCGCSDTAARPRTGSARPRSRPWSWRPKMPACSSPAKRR